MALLELKNLKTFFATKRGTVKAVNGVSYSLDAGKVLGVVGESGSGKTTLLNILAALDEPTAGTVRLDGHELGKIRERDAAAFRRDNLGFVFQEFNLLDTFTLEDNIYLPLVLAGVHLCFAFPFIHKLLILFNLDNRGLLIGTTAVSFAVFALLYAIVYKLTGNTYYRIVAEDTEKE